MSPSRILFIDDEPEFVRPHIMALQDAGFNVIHVMTYAEALAQLQSQQFDLIILDLILPCGDVQGELEGHIPGVEIGLELYRTIRNTSRLSGLPVLFLTVNNGTDINSLLSSPSERTGIYEIVEKPAWPSKVVATARRLLGG